MKRIISILLTLILAASCCIFSAAAEDAYRDPAEQPVEPVINPTLNPALHPKLTLDLLKAIEAASPQDTEQDLMGLHIAVFFDEDYKAIDEMPSWPDSAVNTEYSVYVSGLNKKHVRNALGVDPLSFSGQYVDWYMPGCIIIHDVNLDDIMLCERSEGVKSIDVFDAHMREGKLDRYTQIAMNVFEPDDYIPVWVGNAAHMKAVDEMPSWPTGRNHDLAGTQEQLMKARAEYSAYEKEFNDAFVAAAFDGIDAVAYDGYGFMALAAVKVSDIEKLTARDCVRYIEYSENQICEIDVDLDDGSKVTPLLTEALLSADPVPEPGYGLNIAVYFSEKYQALNDMPAWPDRSAVNEYADYLVAKNTAVLDGDLNGIRCSGKSYILPGFTIYYDVYPEDVAILEQSGQVALIDLIDPLSNRNGAYHKYNYKLYAALNVLSPDDFITVWVGNAAPVKSITEMPSWPTGIDKNSEEGRNKLANAQREYQAYLNEVNEAFVSEAFADVEDMQLLRAGGNSFLAAVKVSDLETISGRDCVSYLEYDAGHIAEQDQEPVTPEPVHFYYEYEPDAPELTYYEWKLRSQYDIWNMDALDFEILYVHGADGSKSGTDWALVRAFRFDLCYATALHSAVVGGRRLTASDLGWAPFEFAFGIYDAEQDRYYDLTEIDFDDYDGLYALWKNLTLTTPYGRIYEDSPYFDGDADGDGRVSILDATRIQRRLANLCTKYEIVATSADVDRDGSVTILDATRIQRYKASICNLDGTPYDPDRGEWLYYPDE